MNEELEELRQAVASLRSRLDEIAGEVGLSSSGAFAPDGSGTHPVVLPAVLEVPIGQDTGLLHMAIKPFLRRRLGDRNNAAQVLIDMVQRDRSGREFSWLTLPPPLLPGVYDESDGGRTSRLLRALGDDGNRRVLQVLWEGERETARLREQASVSAQDLQRRLTELEEIGWIAESKDDHFLLTERGRRALACARAVASALGGAPTQER